MKITLPWTDPERYPGWSIDASSGQFLARAALVAVASSLLTLAAIFTLAELTAAVGRVLK